MKRIFLSLLSLCAILLYAQSDSLSAYSIDELVVEEMRQSSVRYRVLGKTYWVIESMKGMPMADPLRNIQLLPGVQTVSENTGGIFVQGCNNSHNYTTVNGVPVYYPMHLLGFFSTFNSTHFRHAVFNKTMGVTTANRLGAEVGMSTADSVPTTLGADVDLGMLTSQGSLRLPLGKKVGAILSGRYSNVNLLYDGLVNSQLGSDNLRYCFHDINATLHYTPTVRDVLSFDFFQGRDRAAMEVSSFQLHSRLVWANQTASLRWKHDVGRFSMDNRLYYSAYLSDLEVTQTDSRVLLPANIHTIGAKSEQRYIAARGFFTFGGEVMHHVISPQAPQITGSYGEAHTPQHLQRAMEEAIFFQADFMLGSGVELITGLRTSGFHHEGSRVGVDPRLTLRYQPSGRTTWQLMAGTFTQYLHQVGFSSNGLPSEFWIASSRNVPAQRSAKISLGLQQELFGGDYSLSVEPYLTRMVHQVEYKGNALGLLTDKYDLHDNLVIGDGYNYGVDFMLQKNAGRLTGWIAYAWAKAPRTSIRNGEQIFYPSVHNREHDFNVVGSYRLNDKWHLSATYILATGTPYTDIKRFYILGENAIVCFSNYNGARYPMLHRLDLAVSYQLPQVRHWEHSVKLAVYNATFAKNPISYSYNRYTGTGVLYKRPRYFFATPVPSVSYYLHF